MKYPLLLALLVVGPAAAQAVSVQKPIIERADLDARYVQKPIECADTKTLIQGLASENYKEKPIWWGIEPGVTLSRYSLFVNEQTKSWTLIQFDEKIACVLGTGEDSTRIFNGPKL